MLIFNNKAPSELSNIDSQTATCVLLHHLLVFKLIDEIQHDVSLSSL